MNIRKIQPIAVVLFAWTMIGADGGSCNPWGPSSTPPSTSTTPTNPDKPYCHADPPYGCAALCIQAGADPVFTNNCADLGAGPLTAQFKSLVLETSQAAADGSLCTDATLMAIVTPCAVGIIPKQLESNEFCTPVPPC